MKPSLLNLIHASSKRKPVLLPPKINFPNYRQYCVKTITNISNKILIFNKKNPPRKRQRT